MTVCAGIMSREMLFSFGHELQRLCEVMTEIATMIKDALERKSESWLYIFLTKFVQAKQGI